jgi:hypothetical protein
VRIRRIAKAIAEPDTNPTQMPPGQSSAFPDTSRALPHVTAATWGVRENFSELRGTIHLGRISSSHLSFEGQNLPLSGQGL